MYMSESELREYIREGYSSILNEQEIELATQKLKDAYIKEPKEA